MTVKEKEKPGIASDPLPAPEPPAPLPTLQDRIRYLGTARETDAALVDVLLAIADELDKLRR